MGATERTNRSLADEGDRVAAQRQSAKHLDAVGIDQLDMIHFLRHHSSLSGNAPDSAGGVALPGGRPP
jgi:hypothetical protein